MKGFFNKILVIDLERRSFRSEAVPDSVYERYLGGKGLGAWLLLQKNPPGVDPLSPENILVFGLGPATDQKVHGSARHGIFTKSPQTGFFCESYSGMRAADKISRTGHDAVVLVGRASSPVVLEVSDKGVVFHDAASLWGADAYKTQDEAMAMAGAKDASAVTIGPAGENLVRFATVNNDYWRCAGRAGAGAVLGSKKVKAVVFRGETRREAAEPETLAAHWKRMIEKQKTDMGVKNYRKYGTVQMVAVSNTFGVFPSKYWSQGSRDNWEKISGDALHERFDSRMNACPRCFMACGNMSVVKEGRHKGLKIEGPEFETIYSFGGLCLIEDLEDVAYLNDLCDRLGIDTITAGNLAGFAMHAREIGAIEHGLRWGDVDGTAALLESIAAREGIGADLADGIIPAAKKWGIEDRAIHVKGLEPSGYDPRVLKGMGLAYATSARGACHLRCTFYKPELSGMIDPDRIEDKAKLFIDFEDRATLFDTLIICRFFRDLLPWEDIGAIVKGTTGMDLGQAGLARIAANVTDLTRRFNMREGLTRADDSLPPRFFKERVPPKDKVITEDELDALLDDYYRLRGWDKEGVPPAERD